MATAQGFAKTSSAEAAAPSHDAAAPMPASRPGRYSFIDWLRGFALVIMIETHVVNAYLPAATKQSAPFFWLTFFNGLVAPTFLFAAGFSLILQASRYWESWLALQKPFWIQMRRLGFITLVAYYSHIDDFKLSRFLSAEGQDIWKRTLQVDVLQCIVASLLIVEALILILRKRSRVLWGAALLATGIAMATPYVWSNHYIGALPIFLALFLNPHGVSYFPLFPWTSFVLAGSCAALIFLRSLENNNQNRFMNASLVCGISMIGVGLVGRSVPFTLPGLQSFYTTSPMYVLLRLGCVLVFFALLYRLERTGRKVPGPIQLAGQESLLVYGLHLWVIFGFLRGEHIGPILGMETGYAACFALSAALVVFMLVAARLWQKFKRGFPRLTRSLQGAVIIAMLLFFLSR
jgi:uncharacterized membrane protein